MKEMIEVYEANADSAIITISTLLPKCRHKETCNVTMQILMLYQLNAMRCGEEEGVVSIPPIVVLLFKLESTT